MSAKRIRFLGHNVDDFVHLGVVGWHCAGGEYPWLTVGELVVQMGQWVVKRRKTLSVEGKVLR